MTSLNDIPVGAYKVAMVGAAAIWGFSFVVMKDAVALMPPAWLLGIRFLIAALILGIALHCRIRQHLDRRALAAGAVLGIFDFLGFWTQTLGLQHTTPGINAFLTATYCVIVPFAWWVIARRRPAPYHLGAAVIAIAGIWLVSVGSSGDTLTLGLGEGLTLVCALCFAIHMALVSKLVRRNDALVLTAVQFLVEGLLGCSVGSLTEALPPLTSIAPILVGQILFLAVFATVVCFGIQNMALEHVPPAQGALLLSLESVFGVLFSVMLYGEHLTGRLLLGFALIFGGILINEVVGPRLAAKRAIVQHGTQKTKKDGPHD